MAMLPNSNMIFRRNSYTVKVSVVEWQHQNEASVHRIAGKFTNDRNRVREWCQCYSTLRGQTRGVLGKRCRLRCGQHLSVNLDHRVSGEQVKRRPIAVEPATVCNYNVPMSTSRRGPGRGGVYAR